MKTLSWAGLAGGTVLGATTVATLRRNELPNDTRLEERVRNELLELASFPSAIVVEVRDRRVLLSGSVLVRDHAPVVEGVLAVPGVRSVRDELVVAAPSGVRVASSRGMRRPETSARARRRARDSLSLFALGSAAGVVALIARGAVGALFAGLGAVLAAAALAVRRAPEPHLVAPARHPQAPTAVAVGYGLSR
jgi:BON domain-containing protein